MTLTVLLIGIFLLLLIIIVLGQVSKIGDLLSKYVGDSERKEENQANIYSKLFVIVGVVGIGLLILSYYSAKELFLPTAASELGRDFTKFFNFFSIPILIVFFIIHALLFGFAYFFRYKRDRKVFYFPENHRMEYVWTAIPLVVCLGLGISAFPKWIESTSPPSEDALHIRITGMQFKWFVNYAGQDNTFGDRDVVEHAHLQNLLGLDPNDENGYDDLYVEEIVLPVGKEVSFDLSAIDVIHDFYLPHFRTKMDAIPGVPTRVKITPDITTEEMRLATENPEFNYEMACAELCGTGHWNMRKVVRVVTQEEYDEWYSNQMLAKELYYNDLLAKQEKDRLEHINNENELPLESDPHHGTEDHHTEINNKSEEITASL